MKNTDLDFQSIHILDLRREHLPQIMEMDEKLFQKPWTENLWEQELTSPVRKHITATINVYDEEQKTAPEVIGHLGMLLAGPEISITVVAVRWDFQRRGVAKTLMLHAVDFALKEGCESFGLEVRASNKVAQKFYHGFGFVPKAVRGNYYGNEDAISMWADDIQETSFRNRMEKIRSELMRAP